MNIITFSLYNLFQHFLTNIEKIFAVNSKYLAELETITNFKKKRASAVPSTKGNPNPLARSVSYFLGEIFARMSDELLCYEQYCVSFKKSMDAVRECRKKADFVAFCDSVEINPELSQLHLDDFLIKPIQRICKYPLLFKELLRSTKPQHPDFQILTKCKEKLEKVAMHINVSKSLAENIQRLIQIETSIAGLPKTIKLAVPSRKIVMEGTLVGSVKRKAHIRRVFLFDDMIIFAKVKNEKKAKYEYRGLLTLMSTTAQKVPSSTQGRFCFKLQDASIKESIIFYAPTEKERDEWTDMVSAMSTQARKKEEAAYKSTKKNLRSKAKKRERKQIKKLRMELVNERKKRTELEKIVQRLVADMSQVKKQIKITETAMPMSPTTPSRIRREEPALSDDDDDDDSDEEDKNGLDENMTKEQWMRFRRATVLAPPAIIKDDADEGDPEKLFARLNQEKASTLQITSKASNIDMEKSINLFEFLARKEADEHKRNTIAVARNAGGRGGRRQRSIRVNSTVEDTPPTLEPLADLTAPNPDKVQSERRKTIVKFFGRA